MRWGGRVPNEKPVAFRVPGSYNRVMAAGPRRRGRGILREPANGSSAGRGTSTRPPLPGRRASRRAGQLEHPGIVPVYELARPSTDGRPFYTMRFVRGRTLAEAIRDYHRK